MMRIANKNLVNRGRFVKGRWIVYDETKRDITDFKIYVKKQFTLLGDFLDKPETEKFDFKIEYDDTDITIAIFPKDKQMWASQKIEISKSFYNFLETGFYEGYEVFESRWVFREDIDEIIRESFYYEITLIERNLNLSSNKIVDFIMKWAAQNNIRGLASPQNSLFWSKDGKEWKEMPPNKMKVSLDYHIFAKISDTTLIDLQKCIDEKVEPFVALDFLKKAFCENDARYKWIYATIALEIAIKEFLIRKDSNLETIFNALPSPPSDKMYYIILKNYEDFEPCMKRKDIQYGIEIRNQLVHRPSSVKIENQNVNIYVHLVEAMIYQLLSKLYPNVPFINQHYPLRIGLGELSHNYK